MNLIILQYSGLSENEITFLSLEAEWERLGPPDTGSAPWNPGNGGVHSAEPHHGRAGIPELCLFVGTLSWNLSHQLHINLVSKFLKVFLPLHPHPSQLKLLLNLWPSPHLLTQLSLAPFLLLFLDSYSFPFWSIYMSCIPTHALIHRLHWWHVAIIEDQ